MSFLETLLSGMYGEADGPSVDRPCSNCPSSCALAPGQCPACQPYKEKLIDALYQVDHLDEFRAKYEVVDSLPTGATECPHCGAPSGNAFICEYCGMQIQADDGKIRVTSANDIPNPILQAQDIIFERYQAVVQPSAASDTSGDLLGMLASLLLGDVSEQGQATLGSKMTEEEIKEAASMCRVSVSAYLQGLDNGKYPTLPGLKRAATMESRPQGYGMPGYGSSSGMGGLGMGLGAAGLGAAGLGTMMGGGMPGMGNSMGMPGMDSLMGNLMGGSPGYPQQGYGNRPPQSPYGNQRPTQQPPRPTQQQLHNNTRPTQQQTHNNTRPTQQQTRPNQQAHNTAAQHAAQAINNRPTTARPTNTQATQKPTAGQSHAAGRPNMQQKPTSTPAAGHQGKTPKTGAAAPEPPSKLSKWADSAAEKQRPTPPPAARQKTEVKHDKTGGDNRKGKR